MSAPDWYADHLLVEAHRVAEDLADDDYGPSLRRWRYDGEHLVSLDRTSRCWSGSTLAEALSAAIAALTGTTPPPRPTGADVRDWCHDLGYHPRDLPAVYLQRAALTLPVGDDPVGRMMAAAVVAKVAD